MGQQNTSRRRFLRNVAAAGAASAAAPVFAQTTTSTSPATTHASTMPLDDVAALTRALGHDEFNDAEREMMREGLSDRRELLKKIRQRQIDPRTEPAVQFNPRVPGVAYPRGESSFKMSDAPTPAPERSTDPDALASATVADLSRLIHARKITSAQLTKICLDRLDSIGRKLNAVVTLTPDLAIRQAQRADQELKDGKDRGPLHGIPYGAKDLLATKDIPTTWGVKVFEHQTFDYDATVIEKLEQAGAILCAKLSLGELAMGDVWFGGQTRCPWNPKEGSSGSSAGPCAAVAAGCLPFSIGSETLGSIVSPCVVNGTTGLRPTYGRISRYGAMSLSRTMDKLGPIARSVEDLSFIFAAIHGPDDRDPTAARDCPFIWDGTTAGTAADLANLKIGFDVAAFEGVAKIKDPHKRAALEQAISTIRSLVSASGGELTPIHLPPTDAYTGLASLTIAVEAACNFTELVQSGHIRDLVQQGEGAWPNTFRRGMLVPGSDYLRGQQLRAQLQRVMADMMTTKDGPIDVYVTLPYVGPTMSYTNLTGHPSVVTRCGLLLPSDASSTTSTTPATTATTNTSPKFPQPLTIEFIGDLYREDAALRLAHAYERATSRAQWSQKWPKL